MKNKMNRNKLRILDCTLRDGGYYNNWDFSTSLINKYLKTMSAAKIEYVELGFRSFNNKMYRGACAYTTDEFIRTLTIPRNLKVGVMINASELMNHRSKDPIKNIKLLLKSSKITKLNFIRIACHYEEFEKAIAVSNWLKKSGYKVGFNLMQISDRTDLEIENISKLCSKYPIDVVYFADTMGSLQPSRVSKIVTILKKNWKGDIGIHAHDNTNNAIANTQIAFEHGVTWLDGTVTGMGRGAGNAKTEYLIIKYKEHLSPNCEILPILELVDNTFGPMQKKYNWGVNPYYFLAGKNSIHPTFIQAMLNDSRFNRLDIVSAIENLKKSGGKKFNKDLLSSDKAIYASKCTGLWRPISKILNKEVLILGSGPSITEQRTGIENYIKRKKPFVIALNTHKSINEKLVNIRVACNPLSLATDRKKYKSLKKPLVFPLSRFSSEMKTYLSSNKVLDFGMQVEEDRFVFKKNYAIIPNSLAISYAIGIATSGIAKKIFLAGFDGYEAGDTRKIEMDKMFDAYRKSNSKISIISITSTTYNINSISLYTL